MGLDIKDIPEDLVDSYLKEKCGFFVGSGLSLSAGLPDWKGLLKGLIKRAEENKLLSPDRAKECFRLSEDSSKYLMLAEEMKETLGVEFKSYIEEKFSNEKNDPCEAHDLLVSLNKSKFIITTNYDMLIEKAFAKKQIYSSSYKYYEAHAIQRKLFKREFFLLKAHGDANTAAESIVLTDKDYRRLLYKEPGYQSAMQAIFTMYSVIFIGCSLSDPELKLLLNYINAAFPEGGIPHYALMTTETVSATERGRWKKDYNIRIIQISSENNYQDINSFLKFLKEKELVYKPVC